MIMSLIYDMQQLFGVRQFKTPQTILVSPRMPSVNNRYQVIPPYA